MIPILLTVAGAYLIGDSVGDKIDKKVESVTPKFKKGGMDDNKYPELRKISDKISGDTIDRINSSVKNVKSEMPYKSQWVLEEVIKDLEKHV